MNAQSNLEIEWERYPLLSELIKDKDSIPNQGYRGGDYHSSLDDFHDWLLIAAQVTMVARASAELGIAPEGNEWNAYNNRLNCEFRELRSKLEEVHRFVSQLECELGDVASRASHELSKRVEQRERKERSE